MVKYIVRGGVIVEYYALEMFCELESGPSLTHVELGIL